MSSPEIISGNHITDFSGNPPEIYSKKPKKAAGNLFGGGGYCNSQGRDWIFQARMKFSSKMKCSSEEL